MIAQPHIARFLTHCRVECGMAANTIAAYRGDLARLFDHLGDVDPLVVTDAQIGGFVAASGDSASTAKRRLACFRRFFTHLGSDAADRVEVPRQSRRLPRPVSEADAARMIDMTADAGDRLVLELLYGCGLRASEVATARMEGEMVRVRGKGSRDRLVPAPPFVREWLPRVVRMPSRRTVWDVVRRAADRAGVEAHPHMLRHSFATHLLARGCPINAISQMMGHESICTTAGYTALDVRAKRECIKRHHPRA